MIDDEEEVEIEAMDPLYLSDDTCWIADPDLLAHDSAAEGVLAVQYRGGELFYLDGESRKWLNVEAQAKSTKLRPVN